VWFHFHGRDTRIPDYIPSNLRTRSEYLFSSDNTRSSDSSLTVSKFLATIFQKSFWYSIGVSSPIIDLTLGYSCDLPSTSIPKLSISPRFEYSLILLLLISFGTNRSGRSIPSSISIGSGGISMFKLIRFDQFRYFTRQSSGFAASHCLGLIHTFAGCCFSLWSLSIFSLEFSKVPLFPPSLSLRMNVIDVKIVINSE